MTEHVIFLHYYLFIVPVYSLLLVFFSLVLFGAGAIQRPVTIYYIVGIYLVFSDLHRSLFAHTLSLWNAQSNKQADTSRFEESKRKFQKCSFLYYYSTVYSRYF